MLSGPSVAHGLKKERTETQEVHEVTKVEKHEPYVCRYDTLQNKNNVSPVLEYFNKE